jgi:hypothetical protein
MNRALRNPTFSSQEFFEDKLNIVLMGIHPKDVTKFKLKVLPANTEIHRSLTDLYWLRANLCIEFPYYYVT